MIKVVKQDPGYATVEGSDAVYEVSLQAPPSESVMVTFQSSDEYSTLSAQQLAFDASNWSQPQLVVVSGVHDNIIRESPYVSFIRLSTNSADADFGTFDSNSTRGIKPVNFGVLIADSDIGELHAHRRQERAKIAHNAGLVSCLLKRAWQCHSLLRVSLCVYPLAVKLDQPNFAVLHRCCGFSPVALEPHCTHATCFLSNTFVF